MYDVEDEEAIVVSVLGLDSSGDAASRRIGIRSVDFEDSRSSGSIREIQS